jgi:hypothetical protein
MMWFILTTMAFGAPATVLEHRVDVRIDSQSTSTTTTTWIVRVDDPTACAAGLLAPAGLDGATANGALVLEDLVLFPGDTTAGTVFELVSRERLGAKAHSGELLTAPDLPVELASLTVKVPSWMPLAVWGDAEAHAEYATSPTRTATLRWTNPHHAQAAYTTWTGWDQVHERIEQIYEKNKASPGELGGLVAQGMNIQAVARRAGAAVQVTSIGRWETARPAQEVLSTGSGTAVESTLLLLSALRAAGYDAQPGLFRPAGLTGQVPADLPAPTLLPQPLVVVRHRGREVWIDPSTPVAGALPASLVTAVLWTPGDLPHVSFASGVVDGRVAINADGRLDESGALTWTSRIAADGSAAQGFRELLAGSTPKQQTETLERLVRVAYPDVERLSVTTDGLENTDYGLTIVVSAHAPMLTPLGVGLVGDVRPTLAPALAAWLPPRIEVFEQMNLAPPANAGWISLVPPAPSRAQNALIERDARMEGRRAILTWRAQRPERRTSPSVLAEATARLHEGARAGTKLVALPPMTAQVAKALRKADGMTRAQLTTVEAVAWWNAGQPKRAAKVLMSNMSIGVDKLAEAMVFAPRGDPRPWYALSALTQVSEKQLRIAQGFEEFGLIREAWLLSAIVARTTNHPNNRLDALLQTLRLQPAFQPKSAMDPAGAAAWRDPLDLLRDASATATGQTGDASEPRVLLASADVALDMSDLEKASKDLADAAATALDDSQLAMAGVLLAELDARRGAPVVTVIRSIDDAVKHTPDNLSVRMRDSTALSYVGAHPQALHHAFVAARVAPGDPRTWAQMHNAALGSGDLATALYAAERQSDLAPDDVGSATVLSLTGWLARDKRAMEVGLRRSGQSAVPRPSNLAELTEQTPPEALLAVLVAHDDQVVASPVFLGIRAQLAANARLWNQAIRDAFLLKNRHDSHEGSLLYAAATAGRSWTPGHALITASVADPILGPARVEYDMLRGKDVSDAARLHGGDPRADALLELLANPDAAASTAGWPKDMESPRRSTPPGWQLNPTFSAPSGAAAWSEPSTGATAMLVQGSVDAPLPIEAMFTADKRPVASWTHGNVTRYSGGMLPLYVARGVQADRTVFGLGFSVADARRGAMIAAGLP